MPSVSVSPWRARALVAAAIALLELVLLLGVGAYAASNLLVAEVEPVARAQLAPVKPQPKATAPDRPLLARSETSVVVLNGNGVAGAAATTAAQVRAREYVVAHVGNAPTRESATMVMYRKGYEREAARLAQDAGVKLVGPLDGLRANDLMGAHLALVLGR